MEMKPFLFLMILSMLVVSCRSPYKISRAEAASLDTITNINLLESKKKAIYKTDRGEYYIMRYEPDPEDSTGFQDTIQGGGGGLVERIFILSRFNQRCESENFDGSYRAAVKISVSVSPEEIFKTLRSFVKTLPDKDLMADSIAGSGTPRIPSENRNVRLRKAYLYAYSRQTDEDFHVIIGTSRKPASTTRYFNVEISGLPPAADASFPALKATRDSFLTKASQHLCTSGYFFYNTPLKIEIAGSLFFDKQHHSGLIGPASARPPDAWEIHPVTFLNYK